MLFCGISLIYSQSISNDSSKIVVAVQASDLPILMPDVNYPVDIAASGIPFDNLKVSATNAILTGDNGHYFLKPNKTGVCILTIVANNQIIAKRTLKVIRFRNPIRDWLGLILDFLIVIAPITMFIIGVLRKNKVLIISSFLLGFLLIVFIFVLGQALDTM